MRRSADRFRSPRALVLVLTALLPLSCSFLPERETPPEPEVPGQFNEEGGAADFSVDWWKDFGSPELDRLTKEKRIPNRRISNTEYRTNCRGEPPCSPGR